MVKEYYMPSPKIHTIDLNFQSQKLSIAAFLIESDHGPILVETGPHSTYNYLIERIQAIGYTPSDIKHVFITHIHLDHAGAAWAFAEQGASIYLHPLGYRHMHDPSKLLASAQMIYQDMMDQLWGTLKPIPSDQLQIIEDGQSVQIGSLEFVAHHTPGHAKHHIAWQMDSVLFTGDVAGVSINGGPVIPPCPPPDINIEDWIESIDKLLMLDTIDTYYLTHFGSTDQPIEHMLKLKSALKQYANFIYPFYKRKFSIEDTLPFFTIYAEHYLTENGMSKEAAQVYEAANPSYMSVSGLMRYWKKKESNPSIIQ